MTPQPAASSMRMDMLLTGQGVLGCNMFAYCNNDPVNLNDSKGECSAPQYDDPDDGWRPRIAAITLNHFAKKYSLDTEDTRPRITGVRYTASTPSGKINSQEYALGIAKVERGKIATHLHFQMRLKYVSPGPLILTELTRLLTCQ